VVILLQEVRFVDNESVVDQEAELDRLHAGELPHNETWRRTYEVTPTYPGERLRLQFLLYRGDALAEPTSSDSYRELHLWINVSDGS
jgi:uncharacterized membrane protein